MHTELERGPRRIRSVIAGLLWGCTVRRSRRRNRHGGPRDVEATSPVERRTTRTVWLGSVLVELRVQQTFAQKLN